MRLSILVLLFSFAVPTVQYCCSDPFGVWCYDSRHCNMFCCNCDRCRRSKRSIAEVPNDAQLRFTSVDVNGDGVISKDEGNDFFMNLTAPARAKREIQKGEWITNMDKNGDGVIQPGEFDETLA